jgi:hypothetical protein
MHNPLFLRIVLVIVTIAATLAGFLGFVKLNSPYGYLAAGVAAFFLLGTVFFVKRTEKSVRFQAFYAAVRDFGEPLFFNNYAAAFERNGTRFDASFAQGKYDPAFKIRFYIPHLREKFFILSRRVLIGVYEDCVRIQGSPLPDDYVQHSRNPEFFLRLLNNRKILSEILSYQHSIWESFNISFEDGDFEISYTPKISQQREGFYRVCSTAVVFHDELKALAEKGGGR